MEVKRQVQTAAFTRSNAVWQTSLTPKIWYFLTLLIWFPFWKCRESRRLDLFCRFQTLIFPCPVLVGKGNNYGNSLAKKAKQKPSLFGPHIEIRVMQHSFVDRHWRQGMLEIYPKNPNLMGWAWEIILWRWSEMIMYLEICNVFFVVNSQFTIPVDLLHWHDPFFLCNCKTRISQKPGKTWLAAHPQQKSILVDQRLELFHIAGQQIPAMCMALSSPKIPKKSCWNIYTPNDCGGRLYVHLQREAMLVSVWCRLVYMNTMSISSLR